jgi:hypothetical protein
VLSILRERSLALFALIIACVKDYVNGEVEWSSSLSKLLIFCDICGYSAFCWIQKSLEEKIEAMDLRVREESDVLSQFNDNTPLSQPIRNIIFTYQKNLNKINSYIYINSNNNNLNNSLQLIKLIKISYFIPYNY